jgi:hypothetical protein
LRKIIIINNIHILICPLLEEKIFGSSEQKDFSSIKDVRLSNMSGRLDILEYNWDIIGRIFLSEVADGLSGSASFIDSILFDPKFEEHMARLLSIVSMPRDFNPHFFDMYNLSCTEYLLLKVLEFTSLSKTAFVVKYCKDNKISEELFTCSIKNHSFWAIQWGRRVDEYLNKILNEFLKILEDIPRRKYFNLSKLIVDESTTRPFITHKQIVFSKILYLLNLELRDSEKKELQAYMLRKLKGKKNE